MIATDTITKVSVTKADLNVQVKVAALFQEFARNFNRGWGVLH